MPNSDYLKVSTIQDKKIKELAQMSNIETKNDTIDTHTEWRTFMSMIAYAFCKGDITYKVAKKYADLSSSVFVQGYDRIDLAYKRGFDRGLEYVHDRLPSRLSRASHPYISEGDRPFPVNCGELEENEAKLIALRAQLEASGHALRILRGEE